MHWRNLKRRTFAFGIIAMSLLITTIPITGAQATSLILNSPLTINSPITYDTVIIQSGGILTANATITVNYNMQILSGGVVTHAAGLASGLHLVVGETLVVASGPASLSRCPGQSASFSVSATGTGLSYQWFKGVSLLAGQTASTLTLPSVNLLMS